MSRVVGLLDSGAFSDAPHERLGPPAALQRQLSWEANASRLWGAPWRSEALVSYDLLIDEKWTGRVRKKERWSAREAEAAVGVTVAAAAYLASQRHRLAPRKLVLACQGVDARQYEECALAVLAHATPADWLGLGGWCILGRQTSWMPTFWAAMRRVIPLAASAGLKRAHIFGVLYRPALGGLLWLCDRHGVTLSTDSSGPVLRVTWKDKKKAGALADTWEGNVAATLTLLAGLRRSEHYREPPAPHGGRQLLMYGGSE